MNGLIRCSNCGKIVPVGTVHMEFVDGVFICEDCLDSATFICDHCEERHLIVHARGVHTYDADIGDTETWCANCVDTDAFECDHCGELFCDECDHNEVDGETWCEDCVENDACWCEDCDSYHESDRGVYLENYDRWVCEDCLNEDYVQCAECDDYIRSGDAFGVRGGEYVCERCADVLYTYCDECEEYVPNDDYDFDHDMCRDCYENRQEAQAQAVADEDERCGRTYDGADDTSARTDNAVVRSYHAGHYDTLNFIGDMLPTWGGLYHHFGLELEVDGMSGTRPRQQRALNMIDALAHDHLHFEHDGSLRNRGFEIITQPHTEDALYAMPWAEILGACSENGYSSHDVGTCGLHMHISRTYFGADKDTQDDNIAKLMQFFELYYDEIVKVSRRSSDQLNWAGKCGTVSKKKLKDMTKGDVSTSRYNAVNITNRNTVEIRIMRGTLNVNSFLACIDFMITAVKNSCRIGWSDTTDDFEWIVGCKPSTLDYLNRRGAFHEAVRRERARIA